jgi:hypothetical protein
MTQEPLFTVENRLPVAEIAMRWSKESSAANGRTNS